jgi:hypothetical protein
MKLSINEKLLKRNKTIAQYSLYGAIALIAGGLLLTLTNSKNEDLVTSLSYLILLPAYILMQVNAMMMHKWGKSPREDEIVTNALKGLDNRYSLYHYTTPVSHVLVGPSGIWIINAFHQQGKITYDESKKRYVQKGGGNFLSKIFALDSLSDIERESNKQRKLLEKYLQEIDVRDNPEAVVANVFYHRDTKVDAKNAHELTMHISKLKDLIRQKGKTASNKSVWIEKLQSKLPETE